MTLSPTALGSANRADAAAADLIEELATRLRAGESVDVDAFIAEHAEHAERLRQLLPAMQVLADLGNSAVSGVTRVIGGPDGGQLGDFRILREIGRGGMGVVYEAEQISLRRRVALKVLPFASTMDPRQLQRFQNEVRAAASIQHPHIVPVYAVGCERGVHFYAMQFIDGYSLEAAIQELKSGRGVEERKENDCVTPLSPNPLHESEASQIAAKSQIDATCGKTLEFRAEAADTFRPGPQTLRCTFANQRERFSRIAEWGIQAAQALEHAHSLGMVHRDIKPANLLVDLQGQIWVTDFGLARTAANPGLTMTGDVIGTLRYMSPEQANAKHGLVDHRTDVYALGATLYELLTLEPAVAGKDREEILRNLAMEEPKKPRTLNGAMPADLETIVLKAMAKESADRYGTAQELAQDLERFVKDEPIRARRPAVSRRLARWSRRHKQLVTVAAALLATAAVLGATFAWVDHDRGVREAETERAAAAAWEEADRWEKLGRWTEALAAAKRAVDLLGEQNGSDELRARARRRRENLALLIRLDAIRLEIAVPIGDGGPADMALADKLYAAAFRDFGLDLDKVEPEEVARRMPDGTIRAELAAALDDWAVLRRSSRRRAKLTDDRPWQRILDTARAADPHPDRNRARDLWTQWDAQAGKEMRALPLDHLHPYSFRMLAQVGGGTHFLREFQRRRPGDFWLNYMLGFNLSLSLDAPAQQMDEASGFLRSALALRPDHPIVLANLGNALLQGTKGEENLHEGVALLEKAARLKPDFEQIHRYLGDGLAKHGKLDEAAAAYRKAIITKPDMVLNHFKLGKLLMRKELWDEAAAAFNEAIRISRPSAESYLPLAQIMLHKGLFTESNKYYQGALDLMPAEDRRRGWVPGAIKSNLSYLDMERRVPLILAGAETASASELVDMAVAWAIFKKHYASAAFLFQKSFVADPRPEQVRIQRYNAACAAVLGGCGRSADAAHFTADQRTALRNQARAWLEAELDLWRPMLLDGKIEKKLVALGRLAYWQDDDRLAGIRAPEALALLSKEEAQSWRQFWAGLPKMTETRLEGTLTFDERIRAHDVAMAQGKTYVIDMDSKAFDTFLRLDDSQGNKLAENDDANPNTSNSRVIFTPTTGGTYRVIASAFQNQGTGAYRVRIREFTDTPLP